jgi:hypothetical protein
MDDRQKYLREEYAEQPVFCFPAGQQQRRPQHFPG